MNKSGASSQTWIEIGSKKTGEKSVTQLTPNHRQRSQKFQMHNLQNDSSRKKFKVHSKSKESSVRNGLKNNNDSKEQEGSPNKQVVRQITENWKINESNIKTGLSFLGKAGIITQRLNTGDSHNQTMQLEARLNKKENSKAIHSIQQQFDKFKTQMLKQLKQIQQKINSVISEVLISFQRQMAKFRASQVSEENKIKTNLQQMIPFSEIIKPKHILHTRNGSQFEIKSNTQKSQNKKLKYAQSQKGLLNNWQKKHEFKKFAQAMKRLKTDIQETSQLELPDYQSNQDYQNSRNYRTGHFRVDSFQNDR